MIKIESALKTSVTYKGTGSQTNFDFPFDYLRKSFVKVMVGEGLMTNPTDYTIDSRTVVFKTAPPSDSVIRIYRETDTTRLVAWADASVLKASDMTIQQLQQLHILEETNEWTKTNSIVLNTAGNAWQGRSYRISNVNDPVDDQDVATKHYIDNEEVSFNATMTALKNQTEQMANQASTHANNAKKSENAAKLSETNAKTSETNAKNSEIAAKLSETNAKTSADSAGASKEAAQSASTTASNYASASRGSANEAQTYKTNAQTYMNNAELYMNNAKNYSENVNVFTPSVSSEGVLSWTNKAGLPNPASVNIKGAKGDKGDTGAQGVQGVKGDKGDTGEQGLQGIAGTAATIRIGSVYTGEPGTNASVTNSGTSTNAILNFTIPRGNPGSGGGTSIDVDAALSDSSLNPVQNKVIKEALDGKLGKTETAAAAIHDGVGNIIADTYAKKTDITNITVDSSLSSSSTNPVQNKVIYNALADKMNTADILSGFVLLGGATNIRWREGTQFVGSINAANYSGTARAATHDGDGNIIVDTYAKKADISGMVKSVNGTAPDASGNVTITATGGASTSSENTWTAPQEFYKTKTFHTIHTGYFVEGTSDTPLTDTMWYNTNGTFTLDLSSFASTLVIYESVVFSAYFTADAEYALTITGAGTMTYVGSASDIAISSSGTLLTIWMVKNANGVVSIVQAHKLGSGT